MTTAATDFASIAAATLNEKFDGEYFFTVSPGGRKYKRIVKNSISFPNSGGSAFMFIEAATGNVLKTDGWATPSKIVRHQTTSETDLRKYLSENADPYGSFLYIR